MQRFLHGLWRQCLVQYRLREWDDRFEYTCPFGSSLFYSDEYWEEK
jgi:hypothetical protein